MGGPDMGAMRAIMRAIFGTDTHCREAERRAADEMLARVEHKVAQFDKALGQRPPRNIDEALRQTSGSDR